MSDERRVERIVLYGENGEERVAMCNRSRSHKRNFVFERHFDCEHSSGPPDDDHDAVRPQFIPTLRHRTGMPLQNEFPPQD